MKAFLETRRLILRRLEHTDLPALREILQDPEVMYAWEHAFTDEQICDWIDKNLQRYETDGFSYMAAFEKLSGSLIGLIGPLIEKVNGKNFVGVAYILKKDQCGKGYATEGANACVGYAFAHLGAEKVVALIRPENTSSRAVAERLGMQEEGSIIKHYMGKEMPHLVYSLTKYETRL